MNRLILADSCRPIILRNRSRLIVPIILVTLSCLVSSVYGSPSDQQACILRLVQTAPDSMTLGQARSACQDGTTTENVLDSTPQQTADQVSVVKDRLSVDETNIFKPFTLMSHRNNYILFGAHNFQGWNTSEYEKRFNTEDLSADDTEVQFQLSIKAPLATDLFGKRIDLFTAYTVSSFWQFYNTAASSPFRETNHEPEAWIQIRPDWKFLGFRNTLNVIGLNHMSNGQGGSLSRSWNRIYAGIAMERGNFVFLLRPWIRIEEDADDDDNPDIIDYYGHGELWLAYKHDKHIFSMMTRNNLESGFSRGAVELGWSFPLFGYPYLKGYIQYFSGYGESLIDYNQYVNRIGFGLQLTDFL